MHHADCGIVVLLYYSIEFLLRLVTLPVDSLPDWSVCVHQAFWAIGAVFEVLLALWIMPTLGWRWLLGLSTIPMAIFLCFCFVSIFLRIHPSKIKTSRGQTFILTFFPAQWLPESPRFDRLTGKTEKAMATLIRIAKENGKEMPKGKMAACKKVRLHIHGW